jgi:hypothetical protein
VRFAAIDVRLLSGKLEKTNGVRDCLVYRKNLDRCALLTFTDNARQVDKAFAHAHQNIARHSGCVHVHVF